MTIQPTTSYIKKKRARRPKVYQRYNGNAYLSSSVKYAFFTIVIIDISILLFVNKTCGAVIKGYLYAGVVFVYAHRFQINACAG